MKQALSVLEVWVAQSDGGIDSASGGKTRPRLTEQG